MSVGRWGGEDARLVQSVLAHLQQHAKDDRIREVATEVLEGRATLADAMSTDAYADAFTTGLTDFFAWRSEADPEVVEEQVNQYREQVEEFGRSEPPRTN